MSNNPKERSVDEIVNSILENIPEVERAEVRLPSLGKMYGLDSDIVHLRALTFDDEKALLGLKDKRQALNFIISRCMEEQIDPNILIQQDKMYLIVCIRNLSVGHKYDINVTCGECSQVSQLSVDVLETFRCDYPDEPLEPLIEFELPVLKKKIVVRRATATELEQPMEKLYENIWRFVNSIDGNSSTAVKLAVIGKLPRKDIHAIIEKISNNDVGLQTSFLFTCNNCGNEEVSDLLSNPDFFTMR